jgi:hypothetical protein
LFSVSVAEWMKGSCTSYKYKKGFLMLMLLLFENAKPVLMNYGLSSMDINITFKIW